MPRIAAALLVVVTIGACIGFNTKRYPIVWQMAANSPHLPSLEESAGQSAAETEQEPAEDKVSEKKPLAIEDYQLGEALNVLKGLNILGRIRDG